MKILFLPETEDYLFELTEILYQKEYFAFKESAVKYVTSLKDDIRENLYSKVKKQHRPSLINMAKNYCILFSPKTKLLNGMFSSMFTRTTERLFS
jgi:hypothetical protein